jgi:hypothetical protein
MSNALEKLDDRFGVSPSVCNAIMGQCESSIL